MKWLAATLVAGAVFALLTAIGWPPRALRVLSPPWPTGLEVRLVADGTPFMAALAKHVREDATAAALGVKPEVEAWGVPGGSGAQRTDAFLTGPDRQTLEQVVKDALAADPSFRLGDGFEIGYQHLHDKDRRWRTLVLAATVFTGSSVTDAEVATAPDVPDVFVMATVDAEAASRLAALTGANVGAKVAISVDGEVRSAPVITGAITAGRIQINPGEKDPAANKDEAYNLLNAMRSGALPRFVRTPGNGLAFTIAVRAGCAVGAGLATLFSMWGVTTVRRRRRGSPV